ncbi:MAG: hypothetical protein M3Y74_09435, partial [Chloroflexota bacterium]|nr:hypothetical protein [Chloroflexota bacterium]
MLATLIAVAPSALQRGHATSAAVSGRVTNTPSITDSSAVTTLRAYATAFAGGRYDAMWRLLTPAARAGWGGQAGYAAYY